ncbi:MAG: hypothetical protein EU539_11205 [Promethearchaeota archaeon]|nr:MAG: hypothetical protein EU539_11205 [Candidatus Lokiarchaeota archaeon]
MVEINKKSLLLGFVMGFLSWLWAFIIVGSAMYDFVANKPRTFIFEFYIALLIVNAIVSVLIFALYLWKYEKVNPIIQHNWMIDALVLGAIVCLMNYVFDIIFFGIFLQTDLLAYFFLESTAGYSYPIIILWMLVLAYLIYGRKD